MISISNGIITMNKGDDVTLNVRINHNGDILELTESDKLMFSVMEPNQTFTCGIIRKITNTIDVSGNAVIKLSHQDTDDLVPGTYFYQIILGRKSDDDSYIYNTVSPKRKFILM